MGRSEVNEDVSEDAARPDVQELSARAHARVMSPLVSWICLDLGQRDAIDAMSQRDLKSLNFSKLCSKDRPRDIT